MMMKRREWPWKGRVRFRRVRNGLVVGETALWVPNLIVNVGRDWQAQVMAGLVPATITHLAWGDGTTAVAASDTALDNEVGRAEVVDRAFSGVGTFTCLTTAFVDSDEPPQTIEEWGWFSNGIMIARILSTQVKDVDEGIQVDREDVF